MNTRITDMLRASINGVTALMLTTVLFAVLPGLHPVRPVAPREIVMISVDRKQLPEINKVERPQPKPPQQFLRSVPTPAQTTADRIVKESFRFAPDLGVQSNNDIAASDRGEIKNQIYNEEDTDIRPVLAAPTPVPYPPEARSRGIEGIVDIDMLVDESGKVVKIIFNQLPSEHFRTPVLRSVMRWRFRPAQIKGVAVSVRVHQKITYRLSQTAE